MNKPAPKHDANPRRAPAPKKPVSTADAIEKLREKDPEPNNESAKLNETLIARAGDGADHAAVKESIARNDPTLSHAAHTSHKSGANEDLLRKKADDAAKHASKK